MRLEAAQPIHKPPSLLIRAATHPTDIPTFCAFANPMPAQKALSAIPRFSLLYSPTTVHCLFEHRPCLPVATGSSICLTPPENNCLSIWRPLAATMFCPHPAYAAAASSPQRQPRAKTAPTSPRTTPLDQHCPTTNNVLAKIPTQKSPNPTHPLSSPRESIAADNACE